MSKISFKENFTPKLNFRAQYLSSSLFCPYIGTLNFLIGITLISEAGLKSYSNDKDKKQAKLLKQQGLYLIYCSLPSLLEIVVMITLMLCVNYIRKFKDRLSTKGITMQHLLYISLGAMFLFCLILKITNLRGQCPGAVGQLRFDEYCVTLPQEHWIGYCCQDNEELESHSVTSDSKHNTNEEQCNTVLSFKDKEKCCKEKSSDILFSIPIVFVKVIQFALLLPLSIIKLVSKIINTPFAKLDECSCKCFKTESCIRQG